MKRIRLTCGAICVAVSLNAGVSALALQMIEIPIVNPGAETGDMAGWGNPDGIYHVTNSPDAPEGSHFFETTEYLGLQSRKMTQLVDVGAYGGVIEDVILSASVAASIGDAEPWPYYYCAAVSITYLNNSLDFLYGHGRLVGGQGDSAWCDTEAQASSHGNWENIRSSVAYIRIELSGAWVWEIQTDPPEVYVMDPPQEDIIDIPEVTRFDNIRLRLIVPEPTTLSLLALGGLALRRRKRLAAK